MKDKYFEIIGHVLDDLKTGIISHQYANGFVNALFESGEITYQQYVFINTLINKESRRKNMKDIELLKNALKSLGVHGHVEVYKGNYNFIVYVNNKYFGIWDIEKKTFVD